MKATERDYSELERLPADFTNIEGQNWHSIVVGCEYDLGITLVSKDDPDLYLFCMHGPSDPIWKGVEMAPDTKKRYTAMFFAVVRQIKKGLVDSRLLRRIDGRSYASVALGEPPSSEICPFNQ